MTKETRQLLYQYDNQLRDKRAVVKKAETSMQGFHTGLSHLRWMIAHALEEGSVWSDEDLNRWVGFIQGVMWARCMIDFETKNKV